MVIGLVIAWCSVLTRSLLHPGPNGQKVRVILVPSFAETGIMVLVNLSTLECSAVHISEKGIQTVNEDRMDELM